MSNGRTIAFFDSAHGVAFQFGDAGRRSGENLVAHVRFLLVLVLIIVLLPAIINRGPLTIVIGKV